jgi:hypothetical protein
MVRLSKSLLTGATVVLVIGTPLALGFYYLRRK